MRDAERRLAQPPTLVRHDHGLFFAGHTAAVYTLMIGPKFVPILRGLKCHGGVLCLLRLRPTQSPLTIVASLENYNCDEGRRVKWATEKGASWPQGVPDKGYKAHTTHLFNCLLYRQQERSY